ncbi:MAG: hypothetical protein U9R17_14545 [Thermodesulfobacteriota bacterium]|nr:hypothetical protein [Thermodesulfobacteriota bacterium]
MRPYEFGDVNKLAGVGFFLSLIGAEVTGFLLYFGQKNYGSFDPRVAPSSGLRFTFSGCPKSVLRVTAGK